MSTLVDQLEHTPIGPIQFEWTENGLKKISLGIQLKNKRPPGKKNGSEMSKKISRELRQYFAGKNKTFNLPLDLKPLTPFQRKVMAECAKIPAGKTCTYGELAARSGHPRAARAVGSVMSKNPFPILIPCHRVLPAGGGFGNYSGGIDIKETLIQLEKSFY